MRLRQQHPGLPALTEAGRGGLSQALYCLKDRAKTYPELLEKAHFILASRPVAPDDAAARLLDTVSRSILKKLTMRLQNAS